MCLNTFALNAANSFGYGVRDDREHRARTLTALR